MLDTLTLRVAFGLVAVCVLLLFYGVTYRTTRSPYCAWWCLALVCFMVSALLFLGNGTRAQVIANPMGNTLGIAGAVCTWAGARSLRERPLRLWTLGIIPGVVMVMSFADDPSHDVWTGGPFFLTGMALALGLSGRELWILRRQGTTSRPNAQHRFAITSLAIMSTFMGGYYFVRAMVFLAVGPSHPAFTVGFGPSPTTLLTMAMLVVVTFGMSALSNEQQTSLLRTQATQDALTGVLNRAELFCRAEELFAAARSHESAGAVMVADLDNFKRLNDTRGHAAGDAALIDFALACRQATTDEVLIGRLGGDEFVLVLPRGGDAERIAHEIAARMRDLAAERTSTTVSFGIAPIVASVGVRNTIIRADIALYRAKAAGRDRVVRYRENDSHELGEWLGSGLTTDNGSRTDAEVPN